MATDWQPAPRPKVLDASSDGERILFHVEGEKPTPCTEVRMFQSPAKIFPPIYNLLMREGDEICPQVVTDYKLDACGGLPGDVAWVSVHDAEGERRVEVRKVEPGSLNEACRNAQRIEVGPLGAPAEVGAS